MSQIGNYKEPMNKKISRLFLLITTLLFITIFTLIFIWFTWKLAVIIFLTMVFIYADYASIPDKWK